MENTIVKSTVSFFALHSIDLAMLETMRSVHIMSGDSLVVLKPESLSKELLKLVFPGISIDIAALACRVPSEIDLQYREQHWINHDESILEYTNTSKIAGFKVLNLRTMKAAWISRYDMRILAK